MATSPVFWETNPESGKTLVMCYVAFVLKNKNKKSTEENDHSEGKKQGAGVGRGRGQVGRGPTSRHSASMWQTYCTKL